VREDKSCNSEDGEDDEIPCVIWGESEGDCIWRGSRRSVGSVGSSWQTKCSTPFL